LGDLLGVGFAKRQLRKLLFYPNICGVPKWYTTLPPSYRKQQGRIAQVFDFVLDRGFNGNGSYPLIAWP
jgi:hypothetical protein